MGNSVAAELSAAEGKALARLDESGWVQGSMGSADHGVCLHGSFRYCDLRPGDPYILSAVFRARGQGEEWNDAAGRTVDEVRAALMVEITDADLESTFGPQWFEVVALIRRVAVLTAEEAGRVSAARAAAWGAAQGAARFAAWGAAWGAARDAARDAAWGAARFAARDAAQDAAQGTAQGAARDAAQGTARGAAWDAAQALSVRDLVGRHGFKQEHYDTLTAPFRAAGITVHPDDAELSEV